MNEVRVPRNPVKRSKTRLIDKEPIREGKPRSGRRYVLNDGTVSPVLSLLFTALSPEFVGALSYGACVQLNRAFSLAVADKVGLAGGAYHRDEHLMYSLLLSKKVMGELYTSLLPWVEVEAPEVKSMGAFTRALRYAMIFDLADRALNRFDIMKATNTTSVYYTMGQMRNAGLIERAALMPVETTAGEIKMPTFILTKKGKTFIGLACDVMERKENTLRAVLKTKE